MSSIFAPRSDGEWLSILNRVYIWAGFVAAIAGVIALLATKGIQIFSDRVSVDQRKHIAELEVVAAQERTERERIRQENLKLQLKVEEHGKNFDDIRRIPY